MLWSKIIRKAGSRLVMGVRVCTQLTENKQDNSTKAPLNNKRLTSFCDGNEEEAEPVTNTDEKAEWTLANRSVCLCKVFREASSGWLE